MNGRTIADDMARQHEESMERAALRDTFAAAALTGILANEGEGASLSGTCQWAYRITDAMLRERVRNGAPEGCEAVRSDHIPDAGKIVEAPGETDKYRRFVGEVMSWISEATGFLHDDVLRTDDARDTITNACSKCWDAFDRIAYPSTNHDAAADAGKMVGTQEGLAKYWHSMWFSTNSDVLEWKDRTRCVADSICGVGSGVTVESSDPVAWLDAIEREYHRTRIELGHLRAKANHDAAPAATAERFAEPDGATGEPGGDLKAALGTGNTPLDVEELLGELHHIAGSGNNVGYDIRRTACDAEHAIDRLRAWVNELQLSKVEIDALQHVVEDGRLVDLSDYGYLRSLLVRLRPEWAEEQYESDRPEPIENGPDADSRVWETPAKTDPTPPRNGTPAEGSVQGECTVPVGWAVVWPGDGTEIDCGWVYPDEATAGDVALSGEGIDGRVGAGTVVPLYRTPAAWQLVHENERLRDKVARLRLTPEENRAVGWAAQMMEVGSLPRSLHRNDAETLRKMLDRLGGER